MTSFTFRADAFETEEEMRAARKRLYKAARRGLIEIQETWVRRMKLQQFEGYYPGKTRKKLRARTGALRSSIGGRVIGTRLGNLEAKMRVGGGRAGYARIQEEGGVITPRQKQFLTVPLSNALRPSTGTLKPSAKIRKAAKGYKTALGPTVILPGRRDPIIYVRRQTKRDKGRLMPLYVLKKSVRIQPRLGAQQKLDAVLKQKRGPFTRALQRAIAGPGAGF